MKTIKVLGSGCANCREAARRIEESVRRLRVPVAVTRVSDLTEYMRYGVETTPAVVINDRLVHSGSVPSTEQIARWLAVI